MSDDHQRDGDPVGLAARLKVPGIIDVHTHFMPDAVMEKVWNVFDEAESRYGVAWPINYRMSQERRVGLLRDWGVLAFTALNYAHRPGMAEWLNEWSAEFAVANPDCLRTATFFPEGGARSYVDGAIRGGARVFKIHLQVSGFDVGDPALRVVWGTLEDAGTPTVIHCGSGPIPGRFTGPEPVCDLLRRFPRLELIVAHMGTPEYEEFLGLADQYCGVRLDTAMAFTDFMERRAPMPVSLRSRVLAASERGDILFGSDFPNLPYSYADALSSLVRLDLGEDWLRQVVWRAAASLFRLAD